MSNIFKVLNSRLSFLAVDKKFTNTEAGNRSIFMFNVSALVLMIFYIIDAIPFFISGMPSLGFALLSISSLFIFIISSSKRGNFFIAKNFMSLTLLLGIFLVFGGIGSDSFAHILLFPFVISQFIIFNRYEVLNRNIYVVFGSLFFFLFEFFPFSFFHEGSMTSGVRHAFEFWLYLVTFTANGASIYYFLQISDHTKEKLKEVLKKEEALNSELKSKTGEVQTIVKQLTTVNKRLRENEQRFRFISEHSRDIIILLDRNCKITYASPSVTEILGYTIEDILDTTASNYVPKREHLNLEKIRELNYGEIQILDKWYRPFWFDIVLRKIDKADFLGYQVSVRDVTDRKNVEKELLSNRSLLERIAETTPNFLYVYHHKEKKITYSNRNIINYLGYGPSDLVLEKHDSYNFIHPDDHKLLDEQYELLKSTDTGQVITSIYRMRHRDGYWVWIESRDTVLQKDESGVVLSLGEARDITKDKENEDTLIRKQNELLSFVEAAPAAIAMLDVNLKFIASSEEWKNNYHLNDDQLIGMQLSDTHPILFKRWTAAIERAMNGEISRAEEDRIEKIDQNIFWLKWEIRPWFTVNNIVGGIIILTEDISLRKQEKQELQIARQKAEAASDAKAQFLSTMSHEIRTPLNSVIGMAHLLLDDDPKPDQIDNLKALVFGAKSLLSLINDILDYSKIEAGGIELEHTDFDLHELLKNITDSFSSLQKNRSVVIELKLSENLPKIIKGDPTRFSQVLNNLIGNAIKFTSFGSVIIRAECVFVDKRWAKINFLVEDSGIGIPKEELERIFDKFSQASSDTTRKFGGTGLGLAITKSLVDLMQGKISVESELGRGSTFSVELDFGLGEIVNEQTHEKVERSISSNLKILLVEDNKMNQLVAGKFLGKWKLEYDVAENGKEAIEKLLVQDYQLILMDLHMPEMDGYEATKVIRGLENSKKRNIPIIALSASVLSSAEDKIQSFGVDDFVSKPFEPERLLNTINKYLQKD